MGIPIKAGVIGLGVGEQHILSYRAIPQCEVVGICDLNVNHLHAVADRYEINGRYSDYRQLLADPSIDVVSICSFDDVHSEQAIAAFEAKKHVMVEKPIALDRQSAQSVLRAQQDSGKYITSNLILRQSPRFIKLREDVQAGIYGDIFAIEGDYIHQILWKITEGWRGKMDFYCVTYGGGIHLIDLMRWILGEEILEVASLGNKVLTRNTSYKYPDTITSLYRFENDCLGKCLTTFGPSRTKFHGLNVYGTKKTFINDLPNAKVFSGDRPEDESVDSSPYPGMAKGDLLPDFIQAIRDEREPNVSARDVFRVMDVCLAAWDALKEGRTSPVSYSL